MVTLKEWFKTKDYGIGLALLAIHSRNRILIQGLSRKNNPDKLEYLLRKEANHQGIFSEEMIPKLPEPQLPAKLMESHSDQVIDLMNTAEEVLTISPVNESWPKFNESWPKSIKDRWSENRDNYKVIRSLHEKLKLMENGTDEDRAPLVQRISGMADKIRENWVVIDSWVPGQEDPVQEAPAIDHKRINANRKFISTNLKTLTEITDAKKTEEIKKKIQKRCDELKQAGEELESFTSEKLKKAGIQC